MKKKTNIVLCILVSLLCMMLSGCAKSNGSENGGADAKHSYTWWTPVGEDSSYYDSYDQNPSTQYMLTKNWKGENGKDTKINIDFQIPASGSAADTLNTIISTGDYADIMDMSMFNGSIEELYNDGMALDLTPYVEKYMPNYTSFLEAHPDLKITATNIIDGERKYLKLYGYIKDMTQLDQWCGYQYRRDWIVKYGNNPVDGSSFSGEYTIKNKDGSFEMTSWKDNVVFPSGGSDPIYISDWEWMLDIFKTAIDDQGITDGYAMSLYYPGYIQNGDLICAFGGGTSNWYKNPDNKVEFGMDSDNFRTYLQCMNTWYKNGWIDTAFPEHASDMFYAIDDAKVRQGKVGLWEGLISQLIGKMDGEGYAAGAVVFAARQPINDIYGTQAQQNITPYTFYQMSLEGSPIIVTDKATKKDMVTLFTFLDYQFSPEGMLLKRMGLNKEQYEATKNELYTKNGLTEGAYTDTVTDSGIHQVEFVDALKTDGGLEQAIRANRLFGVDSVPDGYQKVNSDETETWKHNMNEWIVYKNSGYIPSSFVGLLSSVDAATFSKIQTSINEFGSKNVPGLIKGTKDPYKDADWEAFKKALSKYSPDTNTQIYQTLLDQLSQ